MNTSANSVLLSIAAGLALSASAATTISVDAVNQRWPWNNLVDVDFTISGSESSMAYRIELSATYNNGANRVYANSYLTEPVVEGDGQKRVTWNLGDDCPELKSDDFTVSVTATPLTDNTIPVYMVIDLSSGPQSTKYPVRYTTKAPDLSDDKCRTTEMWLRRIKAGTEFTMGVTLSGVYTLPSSKEMKLTQDFYMAIFETTQQQWAMVQNEWPSFYSNETYRATRPVESITKKTVRGRFLYCKWPENSEVNYGTFVSQMRSRTGLTTFDLPTAAQWEYAALGGAASGSHGSYNLSGGLSQSTMINFARCAQNGGGTADGDIGISEINGDKTGTMTVGHYKPNDYGLYDMLGNVSEMVLDRYSSDWPANVPESDYKGPEAGYDNTIKGTPYSNGASYQTLRYHDKLGDTSSDRAVGARFCVTLD